MKAATLVLTAVTIFSLSSAQAEVRGGNVLPGAPQAPVADATNDQAFAALRGNSKRERVQPRRPQAYSLAELSDFIGHAGTSVILPKGSVVHCPPGMASRILVKPRGSLLPWPDFLIANRNWITTREMTLAQVRGEAPLTEDDKESFTATGKLVIATFRGHPVTVLSPPSPRPPSK